MVDRRRHRGPHPRDAALFAADALSVLRVAVADVSWLLGRDYAPDSTLALAGNRYSLAARQRLAVMRCACGEERRNGRMARRVRSSDLAGERLHVDGYNVLTTVEAAFAGGVLLRGRDTCLRDMASVHGSYRRVEETGPALLAIGTVVAALGASGCDWLLDRPISNSGRLRAILLELAAARGWDWSVELVPDPDPILARSSGIVATSDSAILDRAKRWFGLAGEVIRRECSRAWILDLDSEAPIAGGK